LLLSAWEKIENRKKRKCYYIRLDESSNAERKENKIHRDEKKIALHQLKFTGTATFSASICTKA
jgi:hypothetical protein